jgi:protein-S-isoprenylcysteine O-methyltransferase Ste14
LTFFREDIGRAQLRDAFRYWILIPSAVIASGRTFDFLLALPRLPGHARLIAGTSGLLLTTGLMLIWRAIHDLEVLGQGTPNPVRPPKRLVISGSYALCRHPMFLGYDLAALAVVLLCRSPGMLCFSLPLFFLWEIRSLQKEERILALRFRADFQHYRHEVPFLLPLPFRHG